MRSGDSQSTEDTAVDADPLAPQWSLDRLSQLDLGEMLAVTTRVLFSNPDFGYILANASGDNYAFHRYANGTVYGLMPTVPEVTAHLKLLRAFQELKRSVSGDESETPQLIKKWQVFVSQAVRRFVMFITGLHRRLHKPTNPKFNQLESATFDDAIAVDPDLVTLILTLLPPLDVVMVWHAFMLSPRLYYDHFARAQFLQFALMPMPVHIIADAIDPISFSYRPSQQVCDNYLEIINAVGTHPTDFIYDIEAQDTNGLVVDVYCPICDKLITKAPLSNDENTGFADRDFECPIPQDLPCQHKIAGSITHAELQKRMLYADVLRRRPLAGLFKYFSNRICLDRQKSMRSDSAQRQLQKRVLKLVMLPQFVRRSLTEFMKHELPRFCEKPIITLLRTYLMANPLHLTVDGLFSVWDDLVGAVLRQERFTEKMTQLDWLHNQLLKKTIAELIIRYLRYLNLLTRTDHQRMLVPTLDIDLIWHTHQLSPYFYYQECMLSLLGAVIDHDDKVEEARLDLGFKDTALLYYTKFKEPYLICFCKYCLQIRHTQQKLPGVQILLTLGKKPPGQHDHELAQHPLFLPQMGLTHISHHNAIAMPTYSARQARKHLELRYKGQLPWAAPQPGSLVALLLANSGGNPVSVAGAEYYVLPPFAPIHFDSRHFYEGLCCTIRDQGPNCLGVSGCSGSVGGDTGNGQRIV